MNHDHRGGRRDRRVFYIRDSAGSASSAVIVVDRGVRDFAVKELVARETAKS
jgi:hypothetical protein